MDRSSLLNNSITLESIKSELKDNLIMTDFNDEEVNEISNKIIKSPLFILFILISSFFLSAAAYLIDNFKSYGF